jgi:signal peptidase
MLKPVSRGNKILFALIGIILIVAVGGYLAIHAISGLDSPVSVVMSSSMQHDNNKSQIGIIDTGDVMIVQDPNKIEIQTFIEGTISGYKSFGDYGNVIIYERGGEKNPVIHRAILWIEYDPDNECWSIPSLKDYQGEWSCSTGSKDYNRLNGSVSFVGLTQSKKNVTLYLENMEKSSGYITMGDNPVTNIGFDQPFSTLNHPVSLEEIRSVAAVEIPWMGIVKVYISSDKQSFLSHVPNSIACVVMLFVTIFALIYCCDFYRVRKEYINSKREFEQSDS